MKRTLLLAAGVLACCFATACNGELAGDDSSGSSQGAIGADTANESDKGTATGSGAKDGDKSLDPCPSDGPGKPGDPGPGKPGEQGACFTFDPGDLCSTPDDLKLAATKICAGKDAVAVQIGFDTKGGCSVTCCTEGPPPPPPVDACTWSALGDGKSCIPDADLKLKAQAACTGGELRSIYPAGDCANGSTIAKIECCSASPSPTKGPHLVDKK